jgi:hypothetical protein
MNESPPEQEPILSLRASRVASARKRGLGSAVFASARPVEVKIFADRIEEHQPGLPGRASIRTLRYDQIAQIRLNRGLKWSSISIESTGGHSIVIPHLGREDAETAKALIEEQLTRTNPNQPAPTSQHNLSEELNQLAELHQKQLLTDDEYAAAKDKLLHN